MSGDVVGQIVIIAAGAATIALAGFQLHVLRRVAAAQQMRRPPTRFLIALATRVTIGALIIIVGLGGPRIVGLAVLAVLAVGTCWDLLARRSARRKPS